VVDMPRKMPARKGSAQKPPPYKPPRVKDPIKTAPPGGNQTPGAKKKRRKK